MGSSWKRRFCEFGSNGPPQKTTRSAAAKLSSSSLERRPEGAEMGTFHKGGLCYLVEGRGGTVVFRPGQRCCKNQDGTSRALPHVNMAPASTATTV